MLAPPVATRLKLAHSAGASKLDATRPAVSHPSAIFAGAAQSTVSARTPDSGIGSRHRAHRTAHAHARRSDLGGSRRPAGSRRHMSNGSMRDLASCTTGHRPDQRFGRADNASYARFSLLGFRRGNRIMTKRKQAIVLSRRKPTQTRARITVETIFEATARIIERDGAGAVNTNAIAERAGISVGTLYEYFPNKEAVLIAMARRRARSAGARGGGDTGVSRRSHPSGARGAHPAGSALRPDSRRYRRAACRLRGAVIAAGAARIGRRAHCAYRKLSRPPSNRTGLIPYKPRSVAAEPDRSSGGRRPGWKRDKSIVRAAPSTISSAIASPVAGWTLSTPDTGPISGRPSRVTGR